MEQLNYWMVALASIALFASCATWVALLARRVDGQPFLPYVPRDSVPWGAIGGLLAIVFVALVLAVPFIEQVPNQFENMAPSELTRLLGRQTLQSLVITTMFLTLIATTSRATRSDLGIPAPANEMSLRRDIRVGTVAWLAALAPVYCVQAVLVNALGQESQHPLIQMILKESSSALLAVAFLSAAIVAPVCEELTFRLLLQGFLEKWEDDALQLSAAQTTCNGLAPDDISFVDDVASDTGAGGGAISCRSKPPLRGLFGLPHGWGPIGISSILFALAHYGHGPDPIPLVLLAIILGYTYQRTHRIVPCIVTHMLFNAFSLCALVLLIWQNHGIDPP